MSFTGIPFVSSLALFAAAAAALAALHLLRSRPQRVRVVTTLFWRDARSAARPRTLWHRFRYLATFLLLLTILGLLAFSLSRPVWRLSATPARHVVIVLDAGMSMQAGASGTGEKRFDLALRAAQRQVDSLGARDRLAVIAIDPLPRVVHTFDQPVAAAQRDLRTLRPANLPADTAAGICLARSLLAGRAHPVVRLITDQPTTVPPAVDSGESAPPVTPIRVGDAAANAGIISTLFVPESDDPARGQLRVRVGWWGRSSERVGVRAETVGSHQVLVDERLLVEPGNWADVVSPPLLANGESVDVRLTEPQGITADNELTFRLPRRSPIVIAADEALPVALRMALAASPARLVKADDPGANVRAVVLRATDATSDKPTVAVMGDGPRVAKGAVVRVSPGSLVTEGLDLEHAVCDAGPAIRVSERSGGLTPLLQAGDAVLAALDASDSKAGRLLLSRAVLGRNSTVANHPAFAILLSRAVRQLAGWDPLPWSLPADRAIVDPVWLYHASTTAGPGHVIVVPGDREASDLSRDESMAAAQPRVELGAGRFYTVSQLMLLFALLLLLVETALHARGRIV